jgi:uncharacterized membrane protein
MVVGSGMTPPFDEVSLPPKPALSRHDCRVPPSSGRQVLIALVPGVVAGVIVALTVRPSLGPLALYAVAALFYLVRVWAKIWPLDAEATAEIAAREDPGRPIADLILLVAAVVSLGAIAVAIAQAHDAHGSTHGLEVGFGVGAMVLSWLLVHTIFTLKYARLYYGAGDEGGVEFEHRVRPPYSDFAYLAFTVGMTFQVSDTDLQTADFRRLALRHALVSYLFGAIILAATVNVVASLAG